MTKWALGSKQTAKLRRNLGFPGFVKAIVCVEGDSFLRAPLACLCIVIRNMVAFMEMAPRLRGMLPEPFPSHFLHSKEKIPALRPHPPPDDLCTRNQELVASNRASFWLGQVTFLSLIRRHKGKMWVNQNFLYCYCL